MKVSALGVEEQRVNVIIDLVGDAGSALGDGFRVEVRIVTWQADRVLKAPIGSLFRRGDGWAVFVVSGDVARLRPVEIGQRNDTEAEIAGRSLRRRDGGAASAGHAGRRHEGEDSLRGGGEPRRAAGASAEARP